MVSVESVTRAARHDAGMVGAAAPAAASDDGRAEDFLDVARTEASTSTRLLRESAFLYGSIYVFIAFKFAAGFLIARFLGPGAYGLRAAFGMVIDHEPFTQLGLYQALHREVPFQRGRGDQHAATRIVSNVFGASLVLAAAFAVISLVAAVVVYRSGADRIFVEFLLFLAAYTVLSRVRHFYVSQLVVDKRTGMVSRMRLLEGSSTAVLTVGFVYLYGLRGIFIGLLGAQAVQLAFLLHRLRWMPAVELSAGFAWRLIRIGFPIMLIAVFSLLFKNVDKMLILGMLSTEMLGYFAAAAIVSKVVFDGLADVFRVMFFPRLMERTGRSKAPHELRPYLTEPTLLIAYFIPILIGALYLSLHLPLRYLAPEFMPAVAVAKILVLGQFFFAIATVPLLVCVALGQQNRVVGLTCAAIALDAILNFAFIRGGWGIRGVAVGTGLSYAALGIAATVLACRQLGTSGRETFRFIGSLMVPFIHAALLLVLIDFWWSAPAPSLMMDLVGTGSRVLVFTLCFSGVLLLLRSHPVWGRARVLLPGGA